MSHPEFEITLRQQDGSTFSAELRFRPPDKDTDQVEEVTGLHFDNLDLPDLSANPSQAREYGLLLGKRLFQDHILAFYKVACGQLQDKQLLRLRLRMGDTAKRLHHLHWETLRHPDHEDRWLLTEEPIVFSRYLASRDLPRVRLRGRSEMRALVVVSAPERYPEGFQPLPPVDVEKELKTAREGLFGMALSFLPDEKGKATLANIKSRLTEEYDILYLACHGALVDQDPSLMLVDDTGMAVRVSGKELETALVGLRVLPRLAILVSCHSGGNANDNASDPSVLAALGPRLAVNGIPAVIACQGQVSMTTMSRFLKKFFADLSTGESRGFVDLAVREARKEVRAEPDSWSPVLFSRLGEGRLWYDRGLVAGERAEEFWPELIDQIKTRQCIPVLGGGLLEPYIGLTREVAYRLARQHRYPMSAGGREDLPQIAQFLRTVHSRNFALERVFSVMDDVVLERFPELKQNRPPDHVKRSQVLAQDLGRAWEIYRKFKQNEPHAVLAEIGFPIFVTTNQDDLLTRALKAAGRKETVYPCRWDEEEVEETLSDKAFKAIEERSPDNPLVFQMFGNLGDTDSMVLAEDDYFHFLMQVTRKQQVKKNALENAKDMRLLLLNGTLASAGLLFLGFRIDDWDFRSFYHFLMRQPGRKFRDQFKHVAVQLDPEDGTHAETVRVKKFLERFFGSHSNIAIYWGSTEEFIEELQAQWKKKATT